MHQTHLAIDTKDIKYKRQMDFSQDVKDKKANR